MKVPPVIIVNLDCDEALGRWPDLAIFAYGSYLTNGPGAVMLTEEFEFLSLGDSAVKSMSKLPALLESYDPAREVIAIQSCLTRIIRLSGSSINTPRILYERSQLPSDSSDDRVAHAFTRYKRRKRGAAKAL